MFGAIRCSALFLSGLIFVCLRTFWLLTLLPCLVWVCLGWIVLCGLVSGFVCFDLDLLIELLCVVVCCFAGCRVDSLLCCWFGCCYC